MSEDQKSAEIPQSSGVSSDVASSHDAAPPPVVSQPTAKKPTQTSEDFDSKAQLIIIQPLSPTLEKIKTILAQNGDATLTEAGSTAEAVQVSAMLKPCVLVASIQNTQDVAKIVQMATLLKNDLKKGIIKCVVISKIKDSKVVSQLEKLGINEIIIEPIPDRQLQFKMGLQVKANKAARKKQKSNDLKKISASKDKSSDGDTKLNGENGAGVKERAAEEVEQDSWLFKNNKPAKKGSKWAFKLEGPDPTEGEWQKMPDATDGESQWRFMPKNPEDAKKGGWQHKGERPEYDGVSGWNFKGINPDLSFVDPEGNKKATKVAVDEEGNIVTTKDSAVAKQKALEKEHKKELEKQEKLNGLKTTQTKAEKKSSKEKSPEHGDHEDKVKDTEESKSEDSSRGGAIGNLKNKKLKDSGEVEVDDDADESENAAHDQDVTGKTVEKNLKTKTDKNVDNDDDNADDNADDRVDDNTGENTHDNKQKSSPNGVSDKNKNVDKNKNSGIDDQDAEGSIEGADQSQAVDSEGKGKSSLKNKKNDEKISKDADVESEESAHKEENSAKEEAKAQQEKKIQDMKKMVDSLEKMADKLPPEKKAKLADFKNKLKEEEKKLAQFRGLTDQVAASDDDNDSEGGAKSAKTNADANKDTSPTAATEVDTDAEDSDDTDSLNTDGKNFLKKKKSKDSKPANTNDDTDDEDIEDLSGDGKNFLKKKRENPFAGGKMDEELAESHSQILDDAASKKAKWGAKDSEQGQDPEGEDHVNIESRRGNSYKAHTTEEGFKEYPLPFFGSPDGIWSTAGVDERKPGDRKIFLFLLPEVEKKQIPDVTKLSVYWIAYERPLRSEKKEAWFFKESEPEKIENFEKLPVQAQKLLLEYTPELMKQKYLEVAERIKKREKEIENEEVQQELDQDKELDSIEDNIRKRNEDKDSDKDDKNGPDDKHEDSEEQEAANPFDQATQAALDDSLSGLKKKPSRADQDEADDLPENNKKEKDVDVDAVSDSATPTVDAETGGTVTDDDDILSEFDKANKKITVPPAALVTPDITNSDITNAGKPIVRPKALSFVLSMSELVLSQATTNEHAFNRYTELMSAAFAGAAVSVLLMNTNGTMRCLYSRAIKGKSTPPFDVSKTLVEVVPPLVTMALNEGGVKTSAEVDAHIQEFAVGIPHPHGGYVGVVLISGAASVPDQLSADIKYLKVTASCIRGFLLAAASTDSSALAA